MSILNKVDKNTPPLAAAVELQRHAASLGFDWPNVQGIFDKIQEEILEVEEALQEGNTLALREEIGDLFFSVINLARFLKIDPDIAIQHSNMKFSKRFHLIEAEMSAATTFTAEQLEKKWQQAKIQLKDYET